MKGTTRWIVVVASCLIGIGASSVLAQDWPQWRGPQRDGKVTGFTAPGTWPKELTQKWKVTVGTGDATPALKGDSCMPLVARTPMRSSSAWTQPAGRQSGKTDTRLTTSSPARLPGTLAPGVRRRGRDGKVCTLGRGRDSLLPGRRHRQGRSGASSPPRTILARTTSSTPRCRPWSWMAGASSTWGAKAKGRSSPLTWPAARRSGNATARPLRIPRPWS